MAMHKGTTTLLFFIVVTAGCKGDGDVVEIPIMQEIGSAGVDCSRRLNSVGDHRGGIFLDVVFSGTGSLAAWQFFASTPGMFYADVWAVDHLHNTAKLMGSNRLVANSPGFHEFVIPPGSGRIHVEGGYVIGIHYRAGEEPALLSWEREPSTSGKMVSRLLPVNPTKENLHVGIELTAPHTYATPALKAVIVGANPSMRLEPAGDYRKGRAEIRLDGVWGTICDKWYEVLGWPNLFCTELGFPGAEYANYTSSEEDSSRYEVPLAEWNSYPIHMYSPRCKLSDNHAFFACDVHPKGHCTHEKDLYLECLPKVSCAFNKTKTKERKKVTISTMSCVPQIYQDRKWGYISDTRPLSAFKRNSQTWAAAYCKELGFDNVKKVKYVSRKMKLRSDYEILRCNPECQVKNPTYLDNCPSGAMDPGCTKKNVLYITCETKQPTGYVRPTRPAKDQDERVDGRKDRRQGRDRKQEKADKKAAKAAEKAAKAAEKAATKQDKLASKERVWAQKQEDKAAKKAAKSQARGFNQGAEKLDKEEKKAAQKAARKALKLQNKAQEQGGDEQQVEQPDKEAKKAAQKAARKAAKTEAKAQKSGSEKLDREAEKAAQKAAKALEKEAKKAARKDAKKEQRASNKLQ